MMWWGNGYGWVWMVIIWVLVIGGVVWLFSQTSSGNRSNDRETDGARRILDERFARGEIDEDDYRRRRDELSR